MTEIRKKNPNWKPSIIVMSKIFWLTNRMLDKLNLLLEENQLRVIAFRLFKIHKMMAVGDGSEETKHHKLQEFYST